MKNGSTRAGMSHCFARGHRPAPGGGFAAGPRATPTGGMAGRVGHSAGWYQISLTRSNGGSHSALIPTRLDIDPLIPVPVSDDSWKHGKARALPSRRKRAARDPPRADGPWIPFFFNNLRSRGLARHAHACFARRGSGQSPVFAGLIGHLFRGLVSARYDCSRMDTWNMGFQRPSAFGGSSVTRLRAATAERLPALSPNYRRYRPTTGTTTSLRRSHGNVQGGS